MKPFKPLNVWQWIAWSGINDHKDGWWISYSAPYILQAKRKRAFN